MKHFSQFVDPGAVRLGLTGPWAANAVAFENPDGSLVVVVGNPWPEAREFAFEGLSATLDGHSFNTFVIRR
jgi:glucosylceramidase